MKKAKRKAKRRVDAGAPVKMSGNHLPLLKFLIEYLRLTSGVEYGAGMWSTPMLYNALQNFVSFESDPLWLERVADKIGVQCVDKYLVYLPVPMIRKTLWTALPRAYQDGIMLFHEFAERDMPYLEDKELLFIDSYAGTRYPALKRWFKFVNKVVVCHDVEKPAKYGYDVANKEIREDYDMVTYLEYRPKEGHWSGVYLKNMEPPALSQLIDAANAAGLVLHLVWSNGDVAVRTLETN